MSRQRTSALVLSYDRATRDSVRWALGEIVDEVQTASSWQMALKQAGVLRPTVAVIDFDRMSPQGRVLLANLLALRYETLLVAVGSGDAVGDAVRHGIRVGFRKPIDLKLLMENVAGTVLGKDRADSKE